MVKAARTVARVFRSVPTRDRNTSFLPRTTPSGAGEWITGPSSGFGGSGSYLFAEVSSPRQPGDIFEVTYDGSVCFGDLVSAVEFYYHMRVPAPPLPSSALIAGPALLGF